MLNVALPKGRLGDKVYSLFKKSNSVCGGDRKLIIEDKELDMRFFLVKPSDAPKYVEYGAADIGVAGKDILLEQGSDVYELLDLKTGKCKLAVAAKKGFTDDLGKPLKVATKFVNVAKEYYSSLNREIEIIKLNGSVELAPLTGLSDVIVDIVETGETLRENDLEVIADIAPVSARLIANKAAYKFNEKAINRIIKELGV